MFRISVQKGFTACHQLKLPDGRLEKLHSHDWLVRASVAADELSAMSLVMDFGKLGEIIEGVVRPLRGSQLEHCEHFRQTNASAENVAKFIFEQIEPHLDRRVRLESVEVMETPGCWAGFERDR